ncbi:Uncharacterised protein [[Clostridium] sordellii]|uniref:rolling circle replication-associated protein n=1 Tax=Paraclostridium sordellii TaxID=1505 RepID=UPI0005DDAE17|nr:hypothetical protein [Paeniclostridium sordellii]CEP50774.1 Uncharacterised protein [[Clostridium] sordellii] [Paeniclostridium sordellii]
MAYDKKVVYCGNVVEIYEYKELVLDGYFNKIEKQKREQTEDVKLENYFRSIKRTKETIRQLVNTNFTQNDSSFLTLTFKDNVQDYDIAFNFWDKFKKKVEYHYKIKLKYLGVVEFQKRGSIHFHICLFNVPYLEHDKLYNLWNKTCKGGVYIEKIGANDCDNVGAYITKYLSKDMDDFFDNKYKGKKRYFKSRNLIEPTVQKFNTKELLSDNKDFKMLENGLKENVVFEYTSKEFEIKRKDYVPVIAEFENVETGDTKEIEIKKELQEDIIAVQQLKYKQVVLNQNNTYRCNKKNNTFKKLI